jgi:hypothetical protein
MTHTLTDSLDTVTQFLLDKITTAATAGTIKSVDGSVVLQPEDIFYGDQEKYPHVPAVAIEPNSRPRTLHGVSYRTDNNFTIYLLVYHASVAQSNQDTRQQVQQIAENIETLIHLDPQFDGLLIHGFCEMNESGYTYRQGTLYRTNRITYSGYSKTALR